MTYGEAGRMAQTLLKGDNSNAEITPLHYRIALREAAMRCEPAEMTAEYTGNETDVFRILPETDGTRQYIKTPVVPDPLNEDELLPIDEQLDLAVIYFVCSLLSNKYRSAYEKKAEKIISLYGSNVIES